MFDELVRLRLEEDAERTAYPRHALDLRNPPVPVTVETSYLLPDPRPEWAKETPLWVRTSGLSIDPVAGSLRGWVLSHTGARFGLVDVELRSRHGQLRLTLPAQLVPEKALSRS